MKRIVVWLIGLMIGVAIDQVIKEGLIVNGKDYVINQGIAWGWGAGWNWSIINLLLMVMLIVWLGFSGPSGLLIAGGTANLIDRWRWGGVVDYIQLAGLPSFNLADIMVVVGAGWLIWKEIKERRWQKKK